MSFTDAPLYFEEVPVGQEWESQRRTVTRDDIVEFARLSGDSNPVHLDEAFARATPFRRPIAHGLLVLSLASGLLLDNPRVRTLAFLGMRDWQFRRPVFIGDTLRLRSQVLQKQARARGRRGEVTWQLRTFNQEDKVVQEGIIATLIEGRGYLGGVSEAEARAG